MAAPFLKWAGGKAKLAPEVLRRAPTSFARYHEPFLGGGAVFFAFEASRPALAASLTDSNASLMACYAALRDDVEAVVSELHALAREYLSEPQEQRPAVYYRVRARPALDPARAAARLIFLNRTGYNGLYRVNSRGEFNVPHGRYARPAIVREQALHDASRALRPAELHCQDFEAACERARPGDFVYLDPPYHPLSRTSSFTAYTADEFGAPHQQRLRDTFAELTRRGVAAVLSNSDHPSVRALYHGRGFTLECVTMSRSINSDGSGRSAIAELLISNLECPEVRARAAGAGQAAG